MFDCDNHSLIFYLTLAPEVVTVARSYAVVLVCEASADYESQLHVAHLARSAFILPLNYFIVILLHGLGLGLLSASMEILRKYIRMIHHRIFRGVLTVDWVILATESASLDPGGVKLLSTADPRLQRISEPP